MRRWKILKVVVVLSVAAGVFSGVGGVFAQGGPDRITIQATDVFPTDLAYDQARDRFLIADATDGAIYAVAADGALTSLVSGEALGFVQSMTVDAATDSLIVVASDQQIGGGQFGFGPGGPGGALAPGETPVAPPAGQGAPGEAPQAGQLPAEMPTLDPNFNPSTVVLVYNLATGAQTRSVDLTGVAPGSLHLGGAVALDASGNIYVADRLGGVVYMVDPSNGVYYLENAALSSQGMAGLNDLVYLPAANCLLVTQTRSGTLWKVPLDNPANVTQVTLPEGTAALRSIMVDAAGNLVALTGGRGMGGPQAGGNPGAAPEAGAAPDPAMLTASLVTLSSGDNWASAAVLSQVEVEGGLSSGAVLRGSEVYVLRGGFRGVPDGSADAAANPVEIVRLSPGA